MKMKNLFAGLVATTIVASSASAFAATYDAENGTVAIGADLSSYAGQQVTVLLVPADENGAVPTNIDDDMILYIDQTAAAAGIFQNMGVKGGALEAGTYYVRIGGEKLADGIIDEKIVIEEAGSDEPELPYYYGDVNGSGGYPDLDDAVEIINYYLWEPSALDDGAEWRFILGNITADRATNDAVDLDDAVEIINYYLWEPSTLDELIPME